MIENQCSKTLLYHITLLREVSITEALWSHPLDGQFDHLSTAAVLPEVQWTLVIVNSKGPGKTFTISGSSL